MFQRGHTDLEKALAKQKAENRKRHRKKNMDSEEITDVENTVAAIITEMKNVAMDDRIANEKSTPAIQKLKLLSTVVDFLKKFKQSRRHITSCLILLLLLDPTTTLP